MGRSVAGALGVVLAAIVATAVAAPHASFDCTKATHAVDKLICSDDKLADADSMLALAYKVALAANPKDRDRIRQAQRAWIAKRDGDCLNDKKPLLCLHAIYGTRLAELWADAPHLGITEKTIATTVLTSPVPLDDRALTAAHPAERAQMGFPQGTFSPKGDLFAFAVDNITSGDPDQIWLYRLADKTLVAATPSPVRDKLTVTIDAFSFVDGTLYIEGSSGEPRGALTPFKRAATMTGAHDVPSIPKAPPQPNLARDTTAAAGDELSSMGDKREEDAHYVVTSVNQGHGAIVLSARAKTGGPEWTIATGDWAPAGFIFDAPRARVLYGDAAKGLVSYDLRTKKTVTAVPVAIGKLLDITADGHLAAYAAYGSCTVRPGKPLGGAQVVCFAKLP